MYLCLYHPENGCDTDNVIKWEATSSEPLRPDS